MTAAERCLIDELLGERRMKAAHSAALVAIIATHHISAKQLPGPELELVLDIARYSRRCELYCREVCREVARRALPNTN